MTNRKCIPSEFKDISQREINSYEYLWDKSSNEKISLHSYVVKTKSKGKKNVLVMSSMPPILGTTKDDGKEKPAIIKFYDFSKGGTDIIDQRMGNYSVNSMSPRWIMSAFAYMLDTMRVNSQTLYSLKCGANPRQTNSFKFGWDLALALVTPLIKIRKAENSKLPVKTKSKMQLILDDFGMEEEEESPIRELCRFPQESPVRRRCHTCQESFVGKNGCSKGMSNLGRVKSQCQFCGNCICPKHTVRLCIKCSKSLQLKQQTNMI